MLIRESAAGAILPSGPSGESSLMIGREDFWHYLRRRVPKEVIVGKKVTKIVIGVDSNSIVFADGSQSEAQLVVGADGIWSVVRRAIFDAPEGRGEYKYSPHYEYEAFVPSVRSQS